MAAGDLIVLDGSTFWSTDANGDVEARRHEGFFYEDVRHLSKWQLRLDQQKLDPITSRTIDYFSVRIVCKGADAGDDAIPARCDETASSPRARTRTSCSRTSGTRPARSGSSLITAPTSPI